jgi:hypothetical protein
MEHTTQPIALVREYPSFNRSEKDRSEARLRIRLVKRREANGTIQLHLDIRKCVVDEKGFMFTRQGVYFYAEELGKLISILTQAQDDIYGLNKGSGMQNLGSDSSKGRMV